MTIKEIPKAFLYICDGCKVEHKQENANGHYTNSNPPHWSTLKIIRSAYDFQGQVVADGSINRLLCGECSTKVFTAINNSIAGPAI